MSGGDGSRRGGGGGGGAVASTSLSGAADRPPLTPLSIVAIVTLATASALPLTTGCGGGSATNDLEMAGVLSEEAVLTVSLGSM